MEKGQLKSEELIKVIDHMGTLSNDELLAKMMDTPAKKLEKMRTQWILFLEETNEAGVLDVMIAAFEEATDLMRTAAQWIKANQKEFDKFAESVKYYYRMFKDILGVLIDHWQTVVAFFVVNKIALGLYGIATAATGVGGAFILAAKAVGAFLVRILLIPALVAAVVLAIEDLAAMFSGKDSMFEQWAKSDNGFISFLSRTVILLGEMARLAWTIMKTGIFEAWGLLTGNMGLVERARVEYGVELINSNKVLDFVMGKTEDYEAYTFDPAKYVSSKVSAVLAQNMIPFKNNNLNTNPAGVYGSGNQTNYVEVVVNNPSSNVDVTNAVTEALSGMLNKDMTNYGRQQ